MKKIILLICISALILSSCVAEKDTENTETSAIEIQTETATTIAETEAETTTFETENVILAEEKFNEAVEKYYHNRRENTFLKGYVSEISNGKSSFKMIDNFPPMQLEHNFKLSDESYIGDYDDYSNHTLEVGDFVYVSFPSEYKFTLGDLSMDAVANAVLINRDISNAEESIDIQINDNSIWVAEEFSFDHPDINISEYNQYVPFLSAELQELFGKSAYFVNSLLYHSQYFDSVKITFEDGNYANYEGYKMSFESYDNAFRSVFTDDFYNDFHSGNYSDLYKNSYINLNGIFAQQCGAGGTDPRYGGTNFELISETENRVEFKGTTYFEHPDFPPEELPEPVELIYVFVKDENGVWKADKFPNWFLM